MSKQLYPLGTKVIVKRLEADSVSKGGIVIPDAAKEKPKRGRVVSVGEGKRLDTGELAAPTVRKGDDILFTSYSGTEIKFEGDELLIMDEADILAVIK